MVSFLSGYASLAACHEQLYGEDERFVTEHTYAHLTSPKSEPSYIANRFPFTAKLIRVASVSVSHGNTELPNFRRKLSYGTLGGVTSPAVRQAQLRCYRSLGTKPLAFALCALLFVARDGFRFYVVCQHFVLV